MVLRTAPESTWGIQHADGRVHQLSAADGSLHRLTLA